MKKPNEQRLSNVLKSPKHGDRFRAYGHDFEVTSVLPLGVTTIRDDGEPGFWDFDTYGPFEVL